VVVDGLDPKVAYSYRLIAFNQAGSSEPSEAVGPIVVGMKEGFADAQPVAWANPSPGPSPSPSPNPNPNPSHDPNPNSNP
jgi:hypothetical protein